MTAFNERLHPRNRQGRFRKKGLSKLVSGVGVEAEGDLPKIGRLSRLAPIQIGARVSLNSVSATVGKSIPIIPGKVRAYVGILGRIEYSSDRKNFVERASDRFVQKVTGKIDNPVTRNVIRKIVGDNKTSINGTRISLTKPKLIGPTVRVSRNIGSQAKISSGRKPRAPRQARGIRVKK